VSSDALIVTVRFKALVSSGSTTVTVSGNAAQGGVPSNPTAQGATLSFGANTPAPSNPSTPKPQNPTPGGSTTPTTPAEPSANSPTMPSVEGGGINESEVARQAEQRQKSLWQWFWWLAIFPALLLVFLGLWLFRRRQARLKLEASQRPIDRTWAAAPVQQHEDPRTNELLEHAPGVGNPDPGSVVSPGTHKADDKK